MGIVENPYYPKSKNTRSSEPILFATPTVFYCYGFPVIPWYLFVNHTKRPSCYNNYSHTWATSRVGPVQFSASMNGDQLGAYLVAVLTSVDRVSFKIGSCPVLVNFFLVSLWFSKGPDRVLSRSLTQLRFQSQLKLGPFPFFGRVWLQFEFDPLIVQSQTRFWPGRFRYSRNYWPWL